ncbi:MAG TPA: helix-turn-helix transcriptional regulator [Polyangiaceae bacterium]|nr:helix-turn-helix transcriptional regulator [Polyangiaceae bacterium]
MPRPSKASLEEVPEIDTSHAKVLRRGPRPDRVLKLPLRGMREAAGKTQADVGAALGSDQAEMSKLERRSDMMLSTLRRYAEAIGARCEVAFVFDKTGHRLVLGDPE